jgi:hypothetical protein
VSEPTSDRDEATRSMGKKEEILRAANMLFEPGQPVEVRLKGREGHIVLAVLQVSRQYGRRPDERGCKWDLGGGLVDVSAA